MQKIQKSVSLAIIAAEASHVFCCVLPTLVSIISLLSGLGLIGALPVGILAFHDLMHGYELPIIVVSGLIIALGWGLYFYSKKLDCHDTGCGHGPCEPKKKSSAKLLIVASLLFVVNVGVYTVFHRGLGIEIPHASAVQAQGHEGHDH